MMDGTQARFLYTTFLKVLDIATVWSAWTACWYLRFNSDLLPITKGLPQHDKYRALGLPIALVFSAVFHTVGAYRRERVEFGFRALRKIVQGCVLGTLVAVSCLYFAGEIHYSRLYLILFTAIAFVAVLIERGLLHLVWSWWKRSYVRPVRTLLVGSSELLAMYVRKIDDRRPYPVQWVGRIGQLTAPGIKDLPWLGDASKLFEVLESTRPDRVVLSFSEEENTAHGEILERLSQELVDVCVLPDFGKYSTFTYSADHECGIPVLLFNQNPMGSSDRAIKRALDILGSLFFLIVFSPLYLLLAALVRGTSRGPVFYSQERVGADGTHFQLYKFRSMRVDAEAQTGAVWAVQGDSRTTTIGKWLRRTSLDEIPQFYNVLRGDMSLVGPRPERPVFVQQFRKEIPKYMLRHKVKSGITGWAQVNGWRGNTSIEERIKHDLYYIGHWSHVLDVKILMMTVTRGFVHRHAY